MFGSFEQIKWPRTVYRQFSFVCFIVCLFVCLLLRRYEFNEISLFVFRASNRIVDDNNNNMNLIEILMIIIRRTLRRILRIVLCIYIYATHKHVRRMIPGMRTRIFIGIIQKTSQRIIRRIFIQCTKNITANCDIHLLPILRTDYSVILPGDDSKNTHSCQLIE